jgi:hypothetical protein
MRKLVGGMAFCVVVWGSNSPLHAQSPTQTGYEKDDMQISTSRRIPTPEQRIYERAAIEAQGRLARIESRHWAGISMQRPTLPSSLTNVEYGNIWYPRHYYSFSDWAR